MKREKVKLTAAAAAMIMAAGTCLVPAAAADMTALQAAPAGVFAQEAGERSNRELNQTILIITHDENIAEQCDRIIVLSDGKIISDEANASAKEEGDSYAI